MKICSLRVKRWNILIFCILLFAVGVFLYQHTYSKFKWDIEQDPGGETASGVLFCHLITINSQGASVMSMHPPSRTTITSSMRTPNFPGM